MGQGQTRRVGVIRAGLAYIPSLTSPIPFLQIAGGEGERAPPSRHKPICHSDSVFPSSLRHPVGSDHSKS